MSTFVSQLDRELLVKVLPPNTSVATPTPSSQSQSPTKQSLRTFFLELTPPTTLYDARESLTDLQQLDSESGVLTRTADEEEVTLRRAILGKLVIGLYCQALNIFLEEATNAETELEWWADIGRSRLNVGYYLLQMFYCSMYKCDSRRRNATATSLPGRLGNLSRTILITLRSQNLPFQLSVLTPSSLRKLFPSSNILRPNTLTIALFPYLRHQPFSISLHATPRAPSLSRSLRADAESVIHAFFGTLKNTYRNIVTLVMFPLDLVHNEVRYKRDELEKVRNERAEVLGALADLRGQLVLALENTTNDEGLAGLSYFSNQLQYIVRGDFGAANASVPSISPNQGVLQPLYAFAYTTLPAHVSFHSNHLNIRGLTRPSRLTRLWPRLVFLPPLALYAAKSVYASRYDLHDMAKEAWYTVRGFWDGWLLSPLKDIVKTVRTTDEDGMIVTKQSVKADLDSLERMTLALAQEKLNYTPEQLHALSGQIRLGDLTPVMQIYEDDIKSPLKSAIAGTLLRTLFVQIQKAKVDIDQALSGIDKLLKSQELTFAFVGVAPALTIVYAVGSYFRSMWAGGRGSGKYGGRKRRIRVWLAMRRIERLLIAQPKSEHPHHAGSSVTAPENQEQTSSPSSIPPLTSGLLLLSVTYLRSYATSYLPQHSRLREGFLEDIADLENPELGRSEKMRVVDRMWRNWGDVFGWRRMAAH